MNFTCKVCSANQPIRLRTLVAKIFRLVLSHKDSPSIRDRFDVGRGTYGEPNVLQWGQSTTLKIGSFCSIAGGVTIFLDGNHRTDWITTYPFPEFRDSAKKIPGHIGTKGNVIIGNDVWIGNNVTILSGVTIGNGAVIGTSAVVAKSIPAYGIAAGNPAKVIRYRFSAEEIALLEKIAWWNWSDNEIDSAMRILLSGDIAALNAYNSSRKPKSLPEK